MKLFSLIMTRGAAASSAVPGTTPSVSAAPVTASASPFAFPATGAAVASPPVSILFVALLFVLIQLSLEFIEVRHHGSVRCVSEATLQGKKVQCSATSQQLLHR